jgi:hypothetical protein
MGSDLKNFSNLWGIWVQTSKTSAICGKQGGGNTFSLRSKVVFFRLLERASRGISFSLYED